MFSSKNQEQTILEFARRGNIAISVESFLVDWQASGLSRYTLKFYRQCNGAGLYHPSVFEDSAVQYFHTMERGDIAQIRASMSHIFISYSRKDLVFAQKIVDALAANNLDTWIDWKSIPKGEDWEQEIYRGIEEAEAFLFLISLDSVRSETCNKEIAHAVKNGKRILPIFIADVDDSGMAGVTEKFLQPEQKKEISRRNYIKCRERRDEFNRAIEETRTTIHTDYEWLKCHTKLQVKALDWERTKNDSRLLRGEELEEAEQRLAGISSKEDIQPTTLQREYVHASRRNEERQRRRITTGLGIGLVALAILAIFAWAQRNSAVASETTAIAESFARATALVNEENARATAQAEKNRAEEQAKLALSRQLAAQAQSLRENNNLDIALILSVEAVHASLSFEARNNLLEMLMYAPRLRAILPTNGSSTMALDSAGKLLAAVYRSTPCQIQFWDVSRIENVVYLGEVIVPENHQPSRLILSSDSSKLAAITNYPTPAIDIWDIAELASPKLISTVDLQASITDTLFHSNGIPVAITEDRTGKRTYLVIGDTQSSNTAVPIDGAEFDRLFSMQFPTGTFTAKNTGSQIELWDVSTPSQPQLLSTVKADGYGYIDGYALSLDRKLLAVNDGSEAVWLWDVSNPTAPILLGKPFSRHLEDDTSGAGETGGGDTIDISPDGNRLAVSHCTRLEGLMIPLCQESVVDVWEISPPSYPSHYLAPLRGHVGSIGMVKFFPNGRFLATSAEGGGILLWDLSGEYETPYTLEVGQTSQEPAGVSSTHNLFVSNISDSQLSLSEITQAGDLQWRADIELSNFGSETTAVISLDSSRLVVAGESGKLAAWDVSNPSEPRFISAIAGDPVPWPHFLALSADGRLLAYVSWGQVNLWKIDAPFESGDAKIPIEWNGNTPPTIALDPSGRTIAVTASDGIIHLWDVSKPEMPQLKGESNLGDDVSQLVFSSDSQLLIIAGEGISYIRMLDISNPQKIQQVGSDIPASVPGLEHLGVYALALDSNNKLLASGICAYVYGEDDCGGAVLLYDLSQPEAARSFSTFLPVMPDRLTFSPDGRFLLTGIGEEHGIWDLSTESWAQHACKIAGRNLTQTEWQQYFPGQAYHITCTQWPAGQ